MESAIKKLKDGMVIYLTPKEKEWLIEQAEKVEQLEKNLVKVLEESSNRLEKIIEIQHILDK